MFLSYLYAASVLDTSSIVKRHRRLLQWGSTAWLDWFDARDAHANLPGRPRRAGHRRGLGASREAVVTAVTQRLGTGPAGSSGRRPFTPAAKRALGLALNEAGRSRDRELTTDHILLGLLADEGDAAEILTGLGATPDRVRQVLATGAV